MAMKEGITSTPLTHFQRPCHTRSCWPPCSHLRAFAYDVPSSGNTTPSQSFLAAPAPPAVLSFHGPFSGGLPGPACATGGSAPSTLWESCVHCAEPQVAFDTFTALFAYYLPPSPTPHYNLCSTGCGTWMYPLLHPQIFAEQAK